MPERSLNTYIFMIERGTGIREVPQTANGEPTGRKYYDLQGRQLKTPQGLCIEERADGSTRKVYINPYNP